MNDFGLSDVIIAAMQQKPSDAIKDFSCGICMGLIIMTGIVIGGSLIVRKKEKKSNK